MHNLDYMIKDVAEHKYVRLNINPEIIYPGLMLHDRHTAISLGFSRLLRSDQSVLGKMSALG